MCCEWHDVLPENSIAACKAAIDAGYAIEVDVRVTESGDVIVFHDKTLDRMTRARGTMQNRSYEELSQYHLGESQERIPSLQDVCEVIADRVPLFVDLKRSFYDPYTDVKAVHAVLSQYSGKSAFFSFDPGAVRKWESVAEKSRIPAGQIFHSENILGKYACIAAWHLYGKPGIFIAVDHKHAVEKVFQKIRTATRPLLAWTVQSQESWIAVEKSVDGIIFEAFKELEDVAL